jgi:hypothetical protein
MENSIIHLAMLQPNASRRCPVRARRALTARGHGESTGVVTLPPVTRWRQPGAS